MLKGKTILIGVTGSIAAYKAADLASRLIKQHARVHVIMTRNACQFISPITFETLTGQKCITDTFDRNHPFEVEHISLAKQADLAIVAPATANIIAKIKNTRTPFGIDFGIGDVIVPGAKKRKLPTQLDEFPAPTVNTYSIETTVAEKLDAILGLMEFSSRMKDYYDLYYLANHFEFDNAVLAEAMRKTFANRGHHFTVDQFEQVIGFDTDEAMQKKWKAFIRKIDTETDDFSTVLKTIKAFLTEPFAMAAE